MFSCSFKYYVEVLYAKGGQETEICRAFMRYLYQHTEFHFEELFFVQQNESDNLILEYFPEGGKFDLRGTEKILEPLPKL